MAVLAGGRLGFAAEQKLTNLVKQELVQIRIGSGQVMKGGPLSYLTIKRSHFLNGPHVLLWTDYYTKNCTYHIRKTEAIPTVVSYSRCTLLRMHLESHQTQSTWFDGTGLLANAGVSQSACSHQVYCGGDIDGDCALHWRAASPQLCQDGSLYN